MKDGGITMASKLHSSDSQLHHKRSHGTGRAPERTHPRGHKLNAAERKRIPSKEFGLPGQKKYPMPDKVHARNALARASQQEKRGNLSPSQAAEIRRKADRKLGKKA